MRWLHLWQGNKDNIATIVDEDNQMKLNSRCEMDNILYSDTHLLATIDDSRLCSEHSFHQPGCVCMCVCVRGGGVFTEHFCPCVVVVVGKFQDLHQPRCLP
jgi:hypothetical protein